MSEPNREGQPGWWPFSLPLPPLPIPLRKNSQTGQGSTLTSPFQSLFSQTQWIYSGRQTQEPADGPPKNAEDSSPGEESPQKPRLLTKDKDRPRVQWLFDRAQVRKQGLMTEEEMSRPPRDQAGSDQAEDDDNDTERGNDQQDNTDDEGTSKPRRRPGNMHLKIPKRTRATFTAANSKTPGWEQPWSPLPPPKAHIKGDKEANGSSYDDPLNREDDDEADPAAKSKNSRRYRRSQTLRGWLLYNNSVPLVRSSFQTVCSVSTHLFFKDCPFS
jgi:hypothetical protein